jgi:hypothetical protein
MCRLRDIILHKNTLENSDTGNIFGILAAFRKEKKEKPKLIGI